MNQKELAAYIDHTVLKATTTPDDVKTLCEEAMTHEFASVCVNPSYVPFAFEILKNSSVKVCTVVGFPLGANQSEVKAFEAELAVKQGATEIDMVINIGAVKAGQWDLVEADVKAVVEATKKANPDAIVKVIIETCLLNETEKNAVCKLLLNTGATFVKTSTGFSTGGATLEDVKLMKQVVADHMLIKASGGVRNHADALTMIQAGANRIGTSNGITIVSGSEASTDSSQY